MSDLPTTTRQWIVRQRPGAEKVSDNNFELKTDVPLSTSGADTTNKVLIKFTHFSTDPAQRTWMDADVFQHRGYITRISGDGEEVSKPGELVCSGAVGRIIHSYNPDYEVGEYVFVMLGWTEYALLDPAKMPIFYKVPAQVTPDEFLGLDLVGQTAYFGTLEVGKLDKEKHKTVVVSSAAGGVGIIVAQLAKRVVGCERVIGIVGSDAKAKRLLEKGFVDIALNYKDPEFEKKFEEATPNFVDFYFDNVGGKILDLNLYRIAKHGTIVSCGAMATYERGETAMNIRSESWLQLVNQSASIRGFLVLEFVPKYAEYWQNILTYKAEGKIEVVTDPKDLTFENIPEGFVSLFNGGNFGKNLIRLV